MNKDALNIKSNSDDWRAAILSNLADTPVKIGRRTYPSVESILQGIKFSDKKRREEVFQMRGIDSLKAGRVVTNSIDAADKNYVYWDGRKIAYNSMEHRLLIAMFIHEKVRQNPDVQKALLETEGRFIYHDVGRENPTTSLPEKFYIQILLSQRKLLKKLLSIS